MLAHRRPAARGVAAELPPPATASRNRKTQGGFGFASVRLARGLRGNTGYALSLVACGIVASFLLLGRWARTLDADAADCLESIGAARTLVVCDPTAFLCDGLAELPVKFIAASPSNVSALSGALSSLLAGSASALTDVVFIGAATAMTPAAAAILSHVAPHGLVATLLSTTPAPASLAAGGRGFSRILELAQAAEGGGGAVPSWQVAPLLEPAPVPAFQIRGLVAAAPRAPPRVLCLVSPGGRPRDGAADLPGLTRDALFDVGADVDTVAALVDAQGPPGALLLRGHRSSIGGHPLPPARRLISWSWPGGRRELAAELAGYDAIFCGDGCNVLDVAAIAELAAAVAVPVFILGAEPPQISPGARLAGYPFIAGGSSRTNADASTVAALGLACSAAGWEAHAVSCRRWLEERRAGVLRLWQERILHGGAAALQWPASLPAPPPSSSTLQPASAVALNSGRTGPVAFFVTELAPVAAGGAGVVATAAALALLATGIDVVVVGHFACSEVTAWDDFARARPAYTPSLRDSPAPRGRLTTLCVDELRATQRGARAQHARSAIVAQRNPYVRAALEAASGLEAAYAVAPFAAVELFDFNGPAAELLRARVDGDAHPYLPPHVRIWVRAHGTMGAIDEIELPPSARGSRRVALRHRLEQYALEAADAVLLPSPPIVTLFSRAYQLRPGAAVYAPLPMATVSSLFLSPPQDSAESVRCLREADALPLPCAGVTSGVACATFLVLGKFQRVKNPEVVAEALAIARDHLRKGGGEGGGGITPQLHAVFVGGDAYCEEHGRHVSQCIPGAVTHEHRRAIHVASPLRKECIPAAVRRLAPAAAVLASEFETFNLVAHELAMLRVPLVVSDVVGFAAFFNATNSYVFRSGSAAALSEALLAAAAAKASGRPRLADGLQYADALEPYRRLLQQASPSDGAGSGEVAGARSLAPALWPSSALRQLLRRDLSLAGTTKVDARSSISLDAGASLCGAAG